MKRIKKRKVKSRLKELIIEKGYSIEGFLDVLLSKADYNREVIRGYIESGKPPHLQHKDLMHSIKIASVLGIKFPELFN